jgi:hypothetical protein
MLTFDNFWEWLVNSEAITIPTLGTQDGNQHIQILNLPPNQHPDAGFFTIHVDLNEGGSITVPNGNTHNFSKELAQRTWDRFFGLLATTARANGFHHVGGDTPAPLPQKFTHQMASAYTLPPNLVGNANLHYWFDCPNFTPCVFIAATIRAFLLTNLSVDHALYTYV